MTQAKPSTISGAKDGTAYPSEATEFTSVSSGIRVVKCVLFLLVIVFSLRLSVYDYPFGIFKLF